jgi:hypothetical protein
MTPDGAAVQQRLQPEMSAAFVQQHLRPGMQPAAEDIAKEDAFYSSLSPPPPVVGETDSRMTTAYLAKASATVTSNAETELSAANERIKAIQAHLIGVEKRAQTLFEEKQVAEESLATVTSNLETTLLAANERAKELEGVNKRLEGRVKQDYYLLLTTTSSCMKAQPTPSHPIPPHPTPSG